MKQETLEYSLERQRLATQPVYVAQPYHVVRSGFATEWPFTRGFASGAVSANSREYLEILGRPSGNTQTVVPEEGQSSIGTLTLPLEDHAGEILRYLSNPRVELAHEVTGTLEARPAYLEGRTSIGGYPAIGTLQLRSERVRYRRRNDAANRFEDLTWAVDGTGPIGHSAGTVMQNGEQLRAGQRVQLLAGYRTLDERAFLRFAKMEVTGGGFSNDGLTYLLQLADIQRFLRRLVFPATQDAPIIIEGHPITIGLRMLLSTGTAAIALGTVQMLAPNVVEGSDETDFKTFIRAGELLVVAPFTADERVLTVTSIESAHRLYVREPIDEDSDTGLDYRRAGVGGVYDVFNGTWGIATPRAFIDVAGLETLREQLPDARMGFRINAPEDAKDFIERELWKPLNLYPFITQNGEYSARLYEGRAGTPVATSIDEDQIIGWTWQGGEDRIINQAEVSYDWNETTAPNQFGLRQRYSANGSIEKYGLRPPFKMVTKGSRRDLGAEDQFARWAFELFQRFSDSAPRLQLIVRYGQHVVDIGDTVPVTHSRIPNRATGTRGLVAEPFQVRDVRPMFGAEGKVVMTLLQVSVLDTIDQPVWDTPELARTYLVIQRASFFNAASVSLPADTETLTGSVTVTLTSIADTVHVTARQYLTSTAAGTAPKDVTGRIRVVTVDGELLDGIMPESFVAATAAAGKGGGIDLYARRGIVKHEVLHAPSAVGPYTIAMTGLCTGTTGSARDRSMVVTVRRP